ncbi:hypothetical protein SLS59_008100 [Nothophoma quercina]|uniref:NADH dehydrogenase [ubiquinone] 1 beta subcomplex subunit 9 n=1 Tax=Nothophoma quercina TaxID=749835 RepID=A0ABR3QVB7_9PLEO
MSSKKHVLSLYRQSLKLALDWSVHRYLWRGQAVYLRGLFEANRNVTEPRQQRALITETENLLEKWKHPDPYRPPTAPGGTFYNPYSRIYIRHGRGNGNPNSPANMHTGSKYERNLPVPILEREYTPLTHD